MEQLRQNANGLIGQLTNFSRTTLIDNLLSAIKRDFDLPARISDTTPI